MSERNVLVGYIGIIALAVDWARLIALGALAFAVNGIEISFWRFQNGAHSSLTSLPSTIAISLVVVVSVAGSRSP